MSSFTKIWPTDNDPMICPKCRKRYKYYRCFIKHINRDILGNLGPVLWMPFFTVKKLPEMLKVRLESII